MPTKKSTPEPDSKPKSAPLVPKSDVAKVFDVAHPGKTAATPSSRPVIVGHTAMIKQDPMVSAQTPISPAAEEKQGEATKAAAHRELTIEPSAELVQEVGGKKPDETTEQPPTSTSDESTTVIAVAEVAETTEPKRVEESAPKNTEQEVVEAKTDSPAEVSEDSKTAIPETPPPDVDAADDSSKPDLSAGLKESEAKKVLDEEAAKKTAEVEALIESRKYFVPTNQNVTQNTAWLWIVIWILILAAGVAVAIDAGYLDIGLDLPFDVIKND